MKEVGICEPHVMPPLREPVTPEDEQLVRSLHEVIDIKKIKIV
jgi:hypothetical protein